MPRCCAGRPASGPADSAGAQPGAPAPSGQSTEPDGGWQEVILRLSLLLLLLYPPAAWYARLPLALLAVLGLLAPRLGRHWGLWASAAALVGLADALGWYAADNHKFLLAYWCLALALAAAARDGLAVASRSARWLLALVFALSVAWKLAAADFVGGGFFEYTLLTDPRFEPVSRLLGGISDQMTDFNEVARRALVSWDSGLDHVRLAGVRQVRYLADLMTGWTLLVEGAVAALFLAGRARALRSAGHALLIAFAASTYLVASVIGFGSTLAVLGAAEAATWSPRWARAHLALFVTLQVYRLPWWGLARDVVARLGGAVGG